MRYYKCHLWKLANCSETPQRISSTCAAQVWSGTADDGFSRVPNGQPLGRLKYIRQYLTPIDTQIILTFTSIHGMFSVISDTTRARKRRDDQQKKETKYFTFTNFLVLTYTFY